MGLVRINGYPMDLSIREAHTFPGEATKFPVEVGADISDHIRDLPPEITLECLVSDIVPGQVANDPARGQTVETPDGEIQFVLPSEEALAKLREIKALRKAITIETSLGVFDSMAFIDLDVPRDKDKNNALFFTAKFSKVNQVTNKRTRVRVRTTMAGAGGRRPPRGLGVLDVPITKRITWKHGVPPGQPWHIPNIVETVTVIYTPPAGQPPGERLAMLDMELSYEARSFGNGSIRFADAVGADITGNRLAALRLDLVRDRQQMGLDAALDINRATAALFLADPTSVPAQPLPTPPRSLPPSVDISKWNLPPPPGPIDDNPADLTGRTSVARPDGTLQARGFLPSTPSLPF